MTRGNNRNVVFKTDRDYYYYLNLVIKYKADLPFNLYHYCLMPNHVHFLVQTQKATDFSLFMKKINLAYFHYYRQNYDWIGHFWQDRYKSQPVGKDAYFIQCGKYIELNPMRAGIVDNPENYQYSSYKYYAQGVTNKLVTADFLYNELGKDNRERQKRYRTLVVSSILEETYRKNIWGSSQQRYNEKQKINRKTKKA
jgi:putative transposase